LTSSRIDSDDLIKILVKINENLEQLNVMLAKLSASKEPIYDAQSGLKALDVMTLLSLPDHLRKTATILCTIGSATAGQVAKESRRTRAVESSYLNQLVVLGHVNKLRKGRMVYFYID